MILQIDNIPDNSLLFTNRVYINFNDYKQLTENLEEHKKDQEDPRLWLILNENWIYTASPHKAIEEGKIALNELQISNIELAITETVNIVPYIHDGSNIRLEGITCYVDQLFKDGYNSIYVINKEELAAEFKKQFSMQILTEKQEIAIKLKVFFNLKIIINSLDFEAEEGFPHIFGLLFSTTEITWKTSANQSVELV